MAEAAGLVDTRLPRLLYVGDVAVSDTYGGEALLYRLLRNYPPDRLAVICTIREGMSQLPGVAYHHWGPAIPRLIHSRVSAEYLLWRAWRYYEVPAAISHIATFFKPDAILSISHVSAWLAGWQLAVSRRVPLHLIVHDDYVFANRFPRWAQGWATRQFAEAYQQAAGRFCISPEMADAYQARFGVPAEVIYPTHNGHVQSSVSERVVRGGGAMTFAHAGSLNSPSDVEQVVSFAAAAAARGHRVISYSPQHTFLRDRATAENVVIDARAPVHSDELKSRLRDEVDCMVLPQSFASADADMVRTAFPTKWSDYTTLGVPLLIWSPTASSSARFVREHPGCAELVTAEDPAALSDAIKRLESSASYRRELAEGALRTGQDVFSPTAAWTTFHRVLREHAAR